MSRPRLQCVVLLLSFLIAAGAPSGASAQFGRIKKALGNKATDEAKTSACVPSRPPTVIETVTLTAAQMAAINAGLDAEIQAAPTELAEADKHQKEADQQAKEYEKARAEYDKANQKYQSCADKLVNDEAAKSEELNQKSAAAGEAAKGEANEDEITKLAERAQAAAERVSRGEGTAEDRATLAEFQKKMTGVRASSDAAMAAQQTSATYNSEQGARVEKACGKQPTEPVPPAGAQLPGSRIRNAGAKAANMSERDYASRREDMLMLVMGNAVVKGSGGGGGGGGRGGQGSGKPSDKDAEAMNQQLKAAAGKVCEMNKAGVPVF